MRASKRTLWASGLICLVAGLLHGCDHSPVISVYQGATSLPPGSGSHDFGSTLVGEASPATVFTITNEGTAELALLSIAATSGPADFVLTPVDGSTVAPGESTTFAITFLPSGPGERAATIRIASNDSSTDPMGYVFTVVGNGSRSASVWYRDADLDEYGDPADFIESASQPDGYVSDNTDCDDGNGEVFPGSHATEVPLDGVDQDCDGEDVCRDLNCDGWPDIVLAQTELDGNYHVDSYIYLGGEGGYSVTNRILVPTVGAMGVDAADLNQDGYLDLVFAAVQDGSTRILDSLVYYGSASGYDVSGRTELPTIGCADPTIADVDRDGWMDIVFSNRFDGLDYRNDSYVYLGSSSGFDAANRIELPTIGASRSRVADLNGDGYNDIVFANGTFRLFTTESYIYWGGLNGWGTDNRSSLFSIFPEALEVADVDRDGTLDILLGSWMGSPGDNNHVYWGSESGTYADDDRMRVEGADGSTAITVADLNEDGYNDLVMPNGGFVGGVFAEVTYLYYGSPTGFDLSDRVSLFSTAASESAVRDLDGDGFLDLVISSHYAPNGGGQEVSQIYWGGPSGYSDSDVTNLPSYRAAGMKIVGSIYPGE